MEKIAIRIYGRVQGVGFRYGARKRAEKLGVICTIARNDPDGSVYLEVEGEMPGALETFIAWCHKGPWSANVERVETERL